MQNEYQLRLKDLNLNERMKEVTDKFTAELEADRLKFELLLQEKNRMETEYEEKLKQVNDPSFSSCPAIFVWFFFLMYSKE